MSNRWGRLYGVGVGPGDPELLTLKAHRILREVAVIAAPTSRIGKESYALRIVQEFMRAEQQILELEFPMRKDIDSLKEAWGTSARLIAERLSLGQDVAFITEGDPLLYSTFIYIHQQIQGKFPEVDVAVIPGISSIHAAAAAAQLPLVAGDERLAILPATYEGKELRETLESFDTVVLLKVASVFDRVLNLLEEMDLVDRAIFIAKASFSEQEVVRDVRSLLGKHLPYLSLMVVKQ